MNWSNGASWQSDDGWYKNVSSVIYTPQTPQTTASGVFASGAGTNQFTATSLGVGTPAFIATRRVYVIAFGSNNFGTTVTSALINSTSATVHSNPIDTSTGQYLVTFSAVITTGSTVSVTMNLSSSSIGSAPIVFAYYFDDSLLTSHTPVSGVNNSGASNVTSLATASYTQTINGFTIAGGNSFNGFTSAALTGLTTDTTFGSGFVMGHLAPVPSTGSTTTTLTSTAATDMVVLADTWH